MSFVSEKQKKDIIINQLIVADVRDEKVISVVSSFPRSLFLPIDIASCGSSDSPIEYKKNRYMLDTATIANMLEIANFKNSDIVLVVGSGLGYGTALVSKFVSRVICIEKDEELVAVAKENLKKLGILNLEIHEGSISNFNLIHPFNRILFEGAFAKIPQSILEMLDYKTDLIAIERKNNLSQVIKATLIDNKVVLRYGRHTPTPYTKGFEEKETFSF
jgi:protein-L-isoaspartate(D-aspartate) O-methyltransferase